MEVLRQEVLLCLSRSRQPMPPQQIAKAVGARVNDVYDELGFLVRHGAARRHHDQDGVMRYAPVRRKAKQPALAVPAITPHQMRPRQPLDRPAPMAESVLAAMGATPMRFTAITAAHGGLAPYQVATALRVLRRRGAVVRVNSGNRGLWQRVAAPREVPASDAAMPPCLEKQQSEPPPDDDDELPPWLGERMRDAFHDIFRAAADASLDPEDPA